MSIEVGNVIPGKVTGITNFGVFVDLGDRKTGLVHISEVSDSFIQDIKEVLKVGDEVKVKVMTIADDGKISLSIRRAVDKPKEDTEDKSKNKKTFTPRNQDSQDFKKNRFAGCHYSPIYCFGEFFQNPYAHWFSNLARCRDLLYRILFWS